MKTRFVIVLLGLLSLCGSSVVLAHNPGTYSGTPLTAVITIYGDSYGHTAYAGNVSLGISSGYAGHGYVTVPFNRHISGPVYGNSRHYRRQRGYGHGRKYGHNKRHHFNSHHDRRR